MKNEMTFTSTQLDLVSTISAFTGEEACAISQGAVSFLIKGDGEVGEIIIDFDEKEIKFVDCNVDTKTYFAIVGFASCRDYTTEDYFTE